MQFPIYIYIYIYTYLFHADGAVLYNYFPLIYCVNDPRSVLASFVSPDPWKATARLLSTVWVISHCKRTTSCPKPCTPRSFSTTPPKQMLQNMVCSLCFASFFLPPPQTQICVTMPDINSRQTVTPTSSSSSWLRRRHQTNRKIWGKTTQIRQFRESARLPPPNMSRQMQPASIYSQLLHAAQSFFTTTLEAYQLFLLHDPRAKDLWPEQLTTLRQAPLPVRLSVWFWGSTLKNTSHGRRWHGPLEDYFSPQTGYPLPCWWRESI